MRIVTGVETGGIDTEAEAPAGRRHELQRPAGARARAGVHATVGFLGEMPNSNASGKPLRWNDGDIR